LQTASQKGVSLMVDIVGIGMCASPCTNMKYLNL